MNIFYKKLIILAFLFTLLFTNVETVKATQQTTTSGTATETTLSLSVFLHGIGNAGDNPNPNGNSNSNKTPVHLQRNLNILVFDASNHVVANTFMPIIYDRASGSFIGSLRLDDTIPAGNYTIKIKTDRYLRKILPGVQQIKRGQDNAFKDIQMIAGDANNDNLLNVLDYNALRDCGYGQLNPLPNIDSKSVFQSTACQAHAPAENVDLDDNGTINAFDYNLFLRELSVQKGD
jgi:hypothetical protein